MNLVTILTIIVIHWFADFVCQTDEDAKGKSKNWSNLLSHTSSYSFVWLCISIFMVGFTGNNYLLLFAPITFIVHTITDYYTSRINSQLHADGKIHEFFVAIGFDQVLHYIQLFITYYYLTK